MSYDKEKYVVRCTKCSVGKDPQGINIGGVISEIGPGIGRCCNCNARYRFVKRDKSYDPDKFIEGHNEIF